MWKKTLQHLQTLFRRRKRKAQVSLLDVVEANPLCTLADIVAATGKSEPQLRSWITMYEKRGKLVVVDYRGRRCYATPEWYARAKISKWSK